MAWLQGQRLIVRLVRLEIVVRRTKNYRDIDFKECLSKRVRLLNIPEFHGANASLSTQECLGELRVCE